MAGARAPRDQRRLVRCPELARELCERGLAHVFQLEEAPPPPLLAALQRAQQAGRGMWAKSDGRPVPAVPLAER